MTTFLHTPYSINCAKFVSQFIKGERYLKYRNNYLLPYTCYHINHDNKIIFGNFIYPMWNTIERNILNKNEQFNHSYIKGADFVLEFHPPSLKTYSILNSSSLQFHSIQISDILLKQNSILLFSIDKDIAEPLIRHKLM